MAEKEPFLSALEHRVLLFDGAMGTEIQKFDPKPEDFPNSQDGFNDGLAIWMQGLIVLKHTLLVQTN